MSDQASSTKEAILQAIAHQAGPEAIATLPPLDNVTVDDIPASSGTLSTAPFCITQPPVPANFRPDPTAVWVGLYSEIPRWKPGSVVKYTVYRSGWPSVEDSLFAQISIFVAALKWNTADVGVTFMYTADLTEASFALAYGGHRDDNVLASAFFPNNNDLNHVMVFEIGLDSRYRNDLYRYLEHELGHVLGLRHEFSMDPDHFEGGATRIGFPNERSVMNYRSEPPEIQESDIGFTQYFYGKVKVPDWFPISILGLPKLETLPIRDYVPQ